MAQITAFLSSSAFDLLVCGVLAVWLYGWKILWKRQLVPALKQNVFLTLLVLQGIVWCILSACGVFRCLKTTRSFAADLTFLPRQAYYLAFLPILAVAGLCDIRRVVRFVQQNNVLLAVMLLFYRLIAKGTMELDITGQLFLCALSLAAPRQAFSLKDGRWREDIRRNYPQWLLMAAALALPASAFGTSTIILLRILYVALFLLRSPHWVQTLASFTLPIILIVSFALPFAQEFTRRVPDANARWRLTYWHDENTALADTYGIGMGYGTAYASQTMIDANPVSHYTDTCPVCGSEIDCVSNTLHGNDQYTDHERPFVTASHNSFVSLAFRLGVLGLALFCLALTKIWRQVIRMRSECTELIFLFCGAVAVIALNVGLENPGYLLTFLLAMAWTNTRSSGSLPEAG